jgi:hypothetical protein
VDNAPYRGEDDDEEENGKNECKIGASDDYYYDSGGFDGENGGHNVGGDDCDEGWMVVTPVVVGLCW